jgi:glycosyltransferase involved in cell wall biosynthesis
MNGSLSAISDVPEMERRTSSSPIRILRIFSRLNIGGPSRHVILLTAGLNDDRFRSTLIVGRESSVEGSMYAEALAHGVQPLVVPELRRNIHPLADLIAGWKLYRIITRWRPHIVHTHASKAGALGRLAAVAARVPVIVHTFHGHTFHSYFHPLVTRIFRFVEARLARRTTKIVAVSESVKRDLVRYGIAEEEQIAVIPLGLELDRFREASRFRGTLRQELGLAEQTSVICSVGRLVAVKNHELLLQAMKDILGPIPHAVVVIVGDGELRKELEQRAASLGLAGRVFFLGWRNDLERIYADADVVVNHSLNEGTPVALIEAMAAARPVVATSVGGNGDVVRTGETGWLVPPNDPPALARTIVYVLTHEEEAAHIAQAARRFVLSQFAAERLITRMKTFYLSLLDESPGTAGVFSARGQPPRGGSAPQEHQRFSRHTGRIRIPLRGRIR